MSIQDIKDEMEKLKMEEGAAQFITEVTRLPYERVLRIYRLGQPLSRKDGVRHEY